MNEFCLEAPIREQLATILENYPGGQLLSEALQNAEDSDASTLTLLLDVRSQVGVDANFSGPGTLLTCRQSSKRQRASRMPHSAPTYPRGIRLTPRAPRSLCPDRRWQGFWSARVDLDPEDQCVGEAHLAARDRPLWYGQP